MRNALIIFAKEPVAGKVKTRLTPFLSDQAAAELYRCMLLDTLNKQKKLEGVATFLFYDGGETAPSFFSSIAPDVILLPQCGRNLGEKMEAAFRLVFDLDYTRVGIVGTDSPDLPLAYIEEAFSKLSEEGVDAVFGPSADGGYYLLALKLLHAELFEAIAWSSPTVLQDSLSKAGEIGIGTALLAPWHDLDTADDLLRPELLEINNGADRTRAFILNKVPMAAHFNTSN